MKKFLSILSSISILLSFANQTVACNNGNLGENYGFITGIDVVTYSGEDIKRDKNVIVKSDSTETDCTSLVTNGTQEEIVVVKLTERMKVFWSHKDMNSLAFVANDIIDYSKWDFLMPNANDFSTNSYQYLLIPITQNTIDGEYIEVMDQNLNYYTFVLNVNAINQTGSINVDLSEIASESDINYSLPKDISDPNVVKREVSKLFQLMMAEIIKSSLAIKQTNQSIRLLGQLTNSLLQVKEYQEPIVSQLFTYYWSTEEDQLQNIVSKKDDNHNFITHPPLAAGKYFIAAESNQDAIKKTRLFENKISNIDNYTLRNYTKLILNIT
ncbi:hypothetical protein [Spiroplasma endosymbiont of Aspidapion aeneum]|uniref:hypothetical protein n=1 Tax=Spiroplasma endosymbiont of Aspidapion aeneum TaxID=3066276 RepID=UPI00313EABD3